MSCQSGGVAAVSENGCSRGGGIQDELRVEVVRELEYARQPCLDERPCLHVEARTRDLLPGHFNQRTNPSAIRRPATSPTTTVVSVPTRRMRRDSPRKLPNVRTRTLPLHPGHRAGCIWLATCRYASTRPTGTTARTSHSSTCSASGAASPSCCSCWRRPKDTASSSAPAAERAARTSGRWASRRSIRRRTTASRAATSEGVHEGGEAPDRRHRDAR